MKRTTIYLPYDLEVRLKQETVRRGQPMAEMLREAVEAYLSAGKTPGPPGAGAFASGHRDTASRAGDVLAELTFGENSDRPRTNTPSTGGPKRRP